MNVGIQKIINNLLSGMTKSASQDAGLGNVSNIIDSLEKVASSDDPIIKVAADQMRAMDNEISRLQSKNDGLIKAAEVREVAEDMLNYGMIDPSDMRDKVAEMLEYSNDQLSKHKEAIKLASEMSITGFFDEVSSSGSSKRTMEDCINENIS